MLKVGHIYYFETNYHDIGSGKLITTVKAPTQEVVLLFEVDPNDGKYGVTYNVLVSKLWIYHKAFKEVNYTPRDDKRYYARDKKDILTGKQVYLYNLLDHYE